jgi:hypothetical protein
MAFNLLKTYNTLLELDSLSETARIKSLEGIFKRDFIDSNMLFRGNIVAPTPKEGKETMAVLFDHLTKRDYEKNRHRDYDRDRSIRLHWIKHHISENSPNKIDIFSVNDPSGIRTYIFDKTESYVVILEPRKNKDSYYLITAYHISEKGDHEKMKRKSKRRLTDVY